MEEWVRVFEVPGIFPRKRKKTSGAPVIPGLPEGIIFFYCFRDIKIC